MTKLGFRGWLLWGEYDSQQFFKLKGKGSGFWIPGTWFQYLSVQLGLWIPIMRGIPDSMSCIPVSKTQDSWFHIPKPRFTYMGQNTVCTNKGLQMKVVVVVVVVHPHLSSMAEKIGIKLFGNNFSLEIFFCLGFCSNNHVHVCLTVLWSTAREYFGPHFVSLIH